MSDIRRTTSLPKPVGFWEVLIFKRTPNQVSRYRFDMRSLIERPPNKGINIGVISW